MTTIIYKFSECKVSVMLSKYDRNACVQWLLSIYFVGHFNQNMKRYTLLTILTFSVTAIFAQTKTDSVTMGSGSPSYPYDVFYNLSTQEKDTVLNTNWHIAFALRPAMPPNNTMQSATIRINESRGVALYKTPFSIGSWNNFTDTAGLSGWAAQHNQNNTWDIGAFNASKDTANQFDYGWGEYDMASHDVLGKNLFLMVITAGANKTYKKIAIQKIMFDSVWLYTISNIDGTDSVTHMINKKAYDHKLFAYYDAMTKVVRDREPNHPWDMVFTYYRDNATFAPYPAAWYNFMGVMTAPQLSVARVAGLPEETTDTTNATSYSQNANVIGWDWKKVYLGPPPSGPYDLTDSLSYFIKRKGDSANVYKFVFSLFTNIPANNIVFNTTTIATHVGLTAVETSIGDLLVYPNPANEIVTVQLSNTKANSAKVQLIDITGKAVQTINHNLNPNTNDILFNVSELNAGIYFVSIETAEGAETRKLIIY